MNNSILKSIETKHKLGELHIEGVYRNKQLTFEDIDKLNYKHFNKYNKKENDYFNPHDYIDIDNS